MKAFAPTLLLLAACATTPAQVPASSADMAEVAGATARASALTVRPGIETFLADVPRALRGKRVGLITNHTGIDRSRTPDIDLIAKHKDLKLVALLAPEHGIRGTAEAARGLDETDHTTVVTYPVQAEAAAPRRDARRRCPDYDPPGGGRTLDLLSPWRCHAAAARRVSVRRLDRPNPRGRVVEGALLDHVQVVRGMYPTGSSRKDGGELPPSLTEVGIGANPHLARVAELASLAVVRETDCPVNPSPNSARCRGRATRVGLLSRH